MERSNLIFQFTIYPPVRSAKINTKRSPSIDQILISPHTSLSILKATAAARVGEVRENLNKSNLARKKEEERKLSPENPQIMLEKEEKILATAETATRRLAVTVEWSQSAPKRRKIIYFHLNWFPSSFSRAFAAAQRLFWVYLNTIRWSLRERESGSVKDQIYEIYSFV